MYHDINFRPFCSRSPAPAAPTGEEEAWGSNRPGSAGGSERAGAYDGPAGTLKNSQIPLFVPTFFLEIKAKSIAVYFGFLSPSVLTASGKKS